jgi:serine/threonine protein kinase/ABC-type branched-subunit amino acid transport system substrate-binding protein
MPTNPISPRPDPMIGRVLKDVYRVDRKLVDGGMGSVYLGIHLGLDRPVAVKTLLSLLHATPDACTRFFNEARILSQLNHPHIVSLLDFDLTPEGLPFLVMEYMEGCNLEGYVPPNEGLPYDTVLDLMQQILSGVTAAHRAHLVHRDLSPANIFVADPNGSPTIKVIDFGIAKALNDSGGKTMDSTSIGNPNYMSPEHFRDFGAVDARSDLFSLGSLLYFMITGREAFPGSNFPEVMSKVLAGKGPAPIDYDAIGKPEARALDPLIRRALDANPQRRFASADDFTRALREAARLPERRTRSRSAGELKASQPPAPAPRKSNLGVGLAAAAALLLGGGFLGWQFLRSRTSVNGPTAAAAPGVSQNEILWGMSAPFSGPSKELGLAMKTGIESCFKATNEAGGVHGRKLALLPLDDGYEPERAQANMREFTSKRLVFGVIGNVGTPTAQAALPVALEHHLPFFGAFTGAPLLRRDPPDRYVFNYRASYTDETAVLVRYLVNQQKIDPKEIAVFAQQDGYGDAGFAGVVKTFRQMDRDPEKILRVGYARNTVDVDEAVARIIANPTYIKGIIMVGTYKPTARFIQRLRDKGRAPVFASVSFVGSEALAEELKAMGPHYAEGVIVSQVVPHPESQSSLVIKYRQALAKYFPEQQPSFGSLEGFIAASLLVEGLRRNTGAPTHDALVDSLESIQNLDLGTGAQLSYGPSRHQASSKVWGTILDRSAKYQPLELE